MLLSLELADILHLLSSVKFAYLFSPTINNANNKYKKTLHSDMNGFVYFCTLGVMEELWSNLSLYSYHINWICILHECSVNFIHKKVKIFKKGPKSFLIFALIHKNYFIGNNYYTCMAMEDGIELNIFYTLLPISCWCYYRNGSLVTVECSLSLG